MTDSNFANAELTIRETILLSLIQGMPRASHEYLEQAAGIAAKALLNRHTRWALWEIWRELDTPDRSGEDDKTEGPPK